VDGLDLVVPTSVDTVVVVDVEDGWVVGCEQVHSTEHSAEHSAMVKRQQSSRVPWQLSVTSHLTKHSASVMSPEMDLHNPVLTDVVLEVVRVVMDVLVVDTLVEVSDVEDVVVLDETLVELPEVDVEEVAERAVVLVEVLLDVLLLLVVGKLVVLEVLVLL